MWCCGRSKTPTVDCRSGCSRRFNWYTPEALKADFDDFVAFDIETSDFDFESSQIVDIAAVRVRDNVVVDQFHSLVSCTRSISAQATEVHGYTDADLIGAPPMSEVWRRFREFVGTDLVVAHNGQEFDVPVLRRACGGFEGFDELVFYDTLPLARAVVDGSVKLKYLAERYNIPPGREHHALDDAVVLAAVVPRLNELRVRRARTVALVHLLDQLGLALALDQQTSPSKEETLFRDITRPFTLGRYSDCLDIYAAELAAGRRRSARARGSDRAAGWPRTDGAACARIGR